MVALLLLCRFLDACQLSVPTPSLLPASKNLHNCRDPPVIREGQLHPSKQTNPPARSIVSSVPFVASAGVKCVTGQCDYLLGSPRPQVWIYASTICMRRLSVIEAEQLLRVVVQDLVSDFLRQAEPLDIGKGLPVDLPILQHRIVAAGHDVTGAERFEGA